MSLLSPTPEDYAVAERVTGADSRDLPIRPVTDLTPGDRFVARGRVRVVSLPVAHHPADRTVSVPCHGAMFDCEYVEDRQVIVLPGEGDAWEETPPPRSHRDADDARRAAYDAILAARQAGVSTHDLVTDVMCAVRSYSLPGAKQYATIREIAATIEGSDR